MKSIQEKKSKGNGKMRHDKYEVRGCTQISKNGHLMFPADIVDDLNRKSYLEKKASQRRKKSAICPVCDSHDVDVIYHCQKCGEDIDITERPISPDKQRDKIAEKIAACRWCDKDGWYHPLYKTHPARFKCDHKWGVN